MQTNYFGIMLDTASQGVMKPEKVKEYMSYLKGFGYNMIQIYTEDAYEVRNEPYFGYMRGGYTIEELKDIVRYGDEIGVTVMPCIQVFGHLNRIFKWKDYAKINDADYILLVDDERTYELIENQFKTVAECFTCKKINIGCDEVGPLGLGQYLKKHGYTDKFALYQKHINRVVDIAKKYGFEPYIWSDMIFQFVSGDTAYYNFKDEQIEKAKQFVPDNVGLIYWEYFYYKPEQYERIFDLHKALGKETWFAGAVHTWTGFTTSNAMTVAAEKAAMIACRNKDIKNVLITLWGGADTSFFAALPTLCYAKCVYEGITDEQVIKDRFKSVTGIDYDLMMDLDAAETLAADYLTLPEIGFSRYVVYQDLFKNFIDPVLKDISVDKYLAKAKEFESLNPEVLGKFKYLFDTQAKLLKLIYYKKGLGMQIREAYDKGNKKALKKLLKKLKLAIKCFKDFYDAEKAQFYVENNESTFTMYDLQIGGSYQRLISCSERLERYINGKLDKIDELEEELLPFNATGNAYHRWFGTASIERGSIYV